MAFVPSPTTQQKVQDQSAAGQGPPVQQGDSANAVAPSGLTLDEVATMIDQAYQAKPEKGILVADYKATKGKEPKLTPGKPYVVEATFSLNTPSGFGSSDGLLLFRQMVDDSGKPYIGPAIEMEKAAAEEKEKYEKAMKARGGAK